MPGWGRNWSAHKFTPCQAGRLPLGSATDVVKSDHPLEGRSPCGIYTIIQCARFTKTVCFPGRISCCWPTHSTASFHGTKTGAAFHKTAGKQRSGQLIPVIHHSGGRPAQTWIPCTGDGTPCIHPSPVDAPAIRRAVARNERHSPMCPTACPQRFRYPGAADKI